MGYACPVCGTAQADAAHLANHLAFTAMLGDDAHESWLEERVPDWADRNPETLGPTVAEYAPERDLEGTTAESGVEGEHRDGPHHDHAHGPDAGGAPRFESELARRSGYGRDAGVADEEVDRVLAEARELTERMAGDEPLGADDGESEDEGEDGAEAEDATEANESVSESGSETDPDGASEAETE